MVMGKRFGKVMGLAMAAGAVAAGAALGAIPEAVHPDFALKEVPMPGKFKTMGMQFLEDGRMVLAVTAEIGMGEMPAPNAKTSVFVVSEVGGVPDLKEVANNWSQIAGLVVAEGKVYVSDRDGFYRILDLENPGNLAGNRKLIVKWPAGNWTHGEQWHQWVFTPMYHQGYFYAPYSGSIIPGGPSSTAPTSEYSGAFLKWDMDGRLEKFAGGLRSPNGANINPAGEMFVADNQGSWLPSSTFMHMKPGRFYGHSNSSQANPDRRNWAEGLPYERPTAWLDHGNVRTSPSQPVHVGKGAYAGDWLLGDCTNPGLVRIALDDVGGTYNGSVFWFSKGMGNSAINRMAWSPDGSLYIGTLLKLGNWPNGDPSPLYRLMPAATPSAFDMRKVRSFRGGVEIAFTEPVEPSTATASAFTVRQWGYVRKEKYGDGKQPAQARDVSEARISDDGRRVFLAVAGLVEDQVVHIKAGAVKSAGGKSLWNNEAWFTLNRQSEAAWESALPVSRQHAAPSRLAGLVHPRRAGPGRLEISIDAEGPHTLALRTLDGGLVASASGTGKARHILSTRGIGMGIHVLLVGNGSETLSLPVAGGF